MKTSVMRWFVGLVCLPVFLMVGCGEESTSPETAITTGTISGTVTYTGGVPSSADTVQVFLFKIPGPPAASVKLDSPGKDSTVVYTLREIEFDTYMRLSVSRWDTTALYGYRTLGYYRTGADTLYSPLTVDARHPDLTGIDVTAVWQ